MSRCFPYPPPGYTLSRANKEALIESIKFQKEREKAKDKEQRKKDKEQRKKDKKREKKEKKKDEARQKLDKSNVIPSHAGEKAWPNTKHELLHKGCEPEPEQLERSSLTEEHGHAVCSNPPTCSSDSTENSNKRKRQCSPEDVNRETGKIIRIRLSKKPDNSCSSAKEQQPCSTPGKSHFPSQHKNESTVTHWRQDLCSTSKEPCKTGQVLPHRINGEQQIQSTSQQIKAVEATRKTEVPPAKKAVMTPMQKMELHYKNMFDTWTPPQLQDASLQDDLEWLFQGKNHDRSTEKKQISGNPSAFCTSSQSLWPRAQYLQEVDVYALPFMVPF